VGGVACAQPQTGCSMKSWLGWGKKAQAEPETPTWDETPSEEAVGELDQDPGENSVPQDRISAPPLTEKGKKRLEELKVLLASDNLDAPSAAICACDATLLRFLRARSMVVQDAHTLLLEHLEWLQVMNPQNITAEMMEPEACTGKIRVSHVDQYGRPIVVMDNSVENTWDVEKNIQHLVFNLDRAVSLMKPGIEKLVVFINLENFAFRSAPSMKASIATCKTLLNHFPERMGHCIMYNPPRVFAGFFHSIRPFLDPVTREKVRFFRGSFTDGSPNDLALKQLLSDDWKAITGVSSARLKPNCSPGYDHETYWATVAQWDRDRRQAAVVGA